MNILIILGIIGLILLYGVIVFNGFIKLSAQVDESFATMDVYLKKRFDLIPNLVSTVKGYASHEKSTLEEVVSARSNISSATTLNSKIEAENNLTKTLKTLFAVAESYPDLKANTNFINLQEQLQKIENDIANSRKYYNAVVREYNIAIRVFPKNIIAGMFNFHPREMFVLQDNNERNNVKVEF